MWHKSFFKIYVAFIVCITNGENIMAIYQKCKSFVRSNKHFKLPVLVKYICQFLCKKCLFGQPLRSLTVSEDFFLNQKKKLKNFNGLYKHCLHISAYQTNKLTILTGKNYVLHGFTQFSTRMAAWLLLAFFIWLHNQLSSTHSTITY